MRFPVWHLPVFAALLLVSPAEASDVKIKTLADGSRLVYNESPAQRTRRTASRLLPVPRAKIAEVIEHYARHHGLSPRLVQAVVQVESGYNPRALSNKGAMGLMQLMPATARLLRVKDDYDPDQNVRGGTTYLRQQIDRFGDLRLALAAYNAGPTAVTRYGGIPPYRETERFVAKVLGLFHHSPPTALQEHARNQARRRHQASAERRSESEGQRVYLTRDANNQLVLTTTPPSAN